MVCNVCKQLRRSHKDITYIIRSAFHKNTFCFQIRDGISLLSLHQPGIWCRQTSCSRQRSFVAWGCMRCAVQKHLPCLPGWLGIQPWWMVWWLSWAALSHCRCLNDQPAKQLFFSHSERNSKIIWVLTASWSRFRFYSVDEREVHTRLTVNIYLNISNLTESWWPKELCGANNHALVQLYWPRTSKWARATALLGCSKVLSTLSEGKKFHLHFLLSKEFWMQMLLFHFFFSFSERVRMK